MVALLDSIAYPNTVLPITMSMLYLHYFEPSPTNVGAILLFLLAGSSISYLFSVFSLLLLAGTAPAAGT